MMTVVLLWISSWRSENNPNQKQRISRVRIRALMFFFSAFLWKMWQTNYLSNQRNYLWQLAKEHSWRAQLQTPELLLITQVLLISQRRQERVAPTAAEGLPLVEPRKTERQLLGLGRERDGTGIKLKLGLGWNWDWDGTGTGIEMGLRWNWDRDLEGTGSGRQKGWT